MTADAADVALPARQLSASGAAPPGGSGTQGTAFVWGLSRRRSIEAEFTAFVNEHYSRLLHLADLLIGDRGRAEDLPQTVLARTYQRWSKVRQGSPVGYVRAGLLNARTDWWRSGLSRERPIARPPEPPAAPDHASRIVGRDAMLRALAVLTARERAVVVLRFYEDFTEAEIADTLGIAAGTVRSTCYRALNKLRISPEIAASASSGKDNREHCR